jgi:hypothetical protein
MVNNEFNWSVELLNGSIINEFDDNGNEHLFKEVLAVINEVKLMTLSWGNKYVKVNLLNGVFNINGNEFSFKGLCHLEGVVYKLIYFKRVTQILSTGGTEKNPNIKYHIGYQVNINGKNYQRIIRIDNISKSMEFLEKNVRAEPL